MVDAEYTHVRLGACTRRIVLVSLGVQATSLHTE